MKIHYCHWSQQPTILLICGLNGEPAWKQPANLPQNVHMLDDSQLYTFDKELITCENCLDKLNISFDDFNSIIKHTFHLSSPNIYNLKNRLEEKLEKAAGQKILLKNDHIAFRSYGIEPFNLSYFHNLLIKYGYKKQADYNFKKKKLRAASYINFKNEEIPRIFVSEPKVEEFSELVQKTLKKSISTKSDLFKGDIYDIYLTGSPLNIIEDIKIDEYEQIRKESEYVSWVLVNGLIPNHFTISINETGFSLAEILLYVQDLGYKLHTGNSIIQKADNLWQASITADQVHKEIVKNGYFEKHLFPTCFYEFAERFNGFDGFEEGNADKIFESTNKA